MATIQWVQTLYNDTIFSKWLISSIWNNLIPIQYTPDCKNITLKNWVTTIRKWYESIVASNVWTKIQWIKANPLNNKLYVCLNKTVKSVNFTNNTYTDIGTISTTDKQINCITFDKYTIFLNWEDYPYLYDGTTLSQLWSWNIEVNANPKFGAIFSWFSFVVWSGAKSNLLYISKPILATAITDCYDWEWTWADIRTMSSNILWVVSTLSKLVIFCEHSIEYLDKSTVATTGWVSTFYTNPIGEWDILSAHRSIVPVWDKIFFLANKKIKTIDYVQWITDLRIWDLSDFEKGSISNIMDWLDDDQSESFGYYNKNESEVRWHVKTIWSRVNDVVIVYNMIAKSFLRYDNKYFSCAEQFNKQYYCWSDINSDLYQDDTWFVDIIDPIERYRYLNIRISNPQIRKMFRWVWINWQINSLWSFNIDVFVDWKTVCDTATIQWVGSNESVLTTWIIGTEIGAESIWWDPIQPNLLNDLKTFNKKISKGKIRAKGKEIKIKVSWNTINTILSLESISVDLISKWDVKIEDKI